jgi:D-amino-acid dehydrogenase
MQVLVMGGGVIGTTTAYYLARAGAEVTVLERQPGVALETSFANAGQVSPGYSTPWAAPGIPLKALKWLFQRHAPLAIRPDGTLYQWQWMLQMLGQCHPRAYALNKARMMRLAEYSRDCLRALREELPLAYDQRSQGTLQLFRTPAQFEAASRDVVVLRDCGVPFELLEASALPGAEPALGSHRGLGGLSGGLRLPNDETGDCQRFTAQLSEAARALGVRFRFGIDIEHLRAEAGRVSGVHIRDAAGRRECLRADHHVLALGSYSRELLAPLGLKIPVYPVKGYSLTLPLENAAAAPVSTVLDESYKVAVTRFDDRIRVGGMAELAGFDLTLRARRRATLEMVVNDLFPGAADTARAEFWTGLRPMTPDGTPIVGATPFANLSLNTGHGTLGWTMACGSARALADLITGRTPEIAVEGLDVGRYSRQPGRSGAGLRPAWG